MSQTAFETGVATYFGDRTVKSSQGHVVYIGGCVYWFAPFNDPHNGFRVNQMELSFH